MYELERYLDPLFRAPISLSLISAASKYVTTAVILGEPLIFTRNEYCRRHNAADTVPVKKRIVQFAVRFIFVGFAMGNIFQDFSVLAKGFPQLSTWQCSHLVAMTLAFSPNTVAAIAVTFCTLQKVGLLAGLPIRSDGIRRASDMLVLIYTIVMFLVYVLPLAVVTIVYGVPGIFVTFYAFVRDIVTLPLKVYSNGLNPVWIAVSIVCNLMFGGLLITLVFAGHVWAFNKKHPVLMQHSDTEDKCASRIEAATGQQISATIIGCVHELVNSKSWTRDVPIKPADMGQEKFLGGLSEEAAEETSILNNGLICCSTGLKVSACIALPLLQVCVVVAAKVYAGHGMWEAAEEVFEERHWSHYFESLWQRGMQGVITLFWYFL